MRLTRRQLLRLGAAAGTSSVGISRSFWTALAAGGGSGEVRLFDVTGLDAVPPAGRAAAFDELHLVSTLQGIVNRDAPRLLVRFLPAADDYWLGVLRGPDNLLDGVAPAPVGSVDELVRAYAPDVRGAVIWDPRVPATSNVASTVAGAEDLVAVRYDLSPESLFMRYVVLPSPWQLRPVRWLVNIDGSSLFTGNGVIPGGREPSTGSAKCDAYVWAQRAYLDSGRCDPTLLGFYIDSWFLERSQDPLRQASLTNHDYLVARRGFVFDLSVWNDEPPVDDVHQPPGTDLRTLRGILASSYRASGGAIATIHGFAPWRWKYSNRTPAGALGGIHDPAAAENRLVSVATQYNTCLDADAPSSGCMVNASVFQHGSLRDRYPQAPVPGVDELRARGLLDAAGRVLPRHYLGFYAGDYDSAAWVYEAMPTVWADPARGTVPVSWAINPNLERRAATILDHLWTTRAGDDVFVSGDSGAGYVNPGLLEEPRPLSGLPSGMGVWADRCARDYARWDISLTGFVIDGESRGMSPDGQRTYAAFSPTGIGMEAIDQYAMRSGVPLLQMTTGVPGTVAEAAERIARSLRPDLDAAPPGPRFGWIRTVLQPPSFHAAVVELLEQSHPRTAITVLDGHTLFALVRAHLAESVVMRTPHDLHLVRDGDHVLVALSNYTGAPVAGFLSLEAPLGWAVSPARTPFHLDVETDAVHPIEVLPPPSLRRGPETTAVLTAVAAWGSRRSRHAFRVTLTPG